MNRDFRSNRRALLLSCAAALALLSGLSQKPASAFSHVVQPGETLASLSNRYYGRIQNERLLSAANFLDVAGISGLTPGQILEIPAITYHRVEKDETWKSIAQRYLGHEKRDIVLAQVNGHKPWIEPVLGQLIALPYNLTWPVTAEESLTTLAYRFLGSTKHTYRLLTYNQLKDEKLKRGQVLLLPISELALTEEGQAAARRAAAQITQQAEGASYDKQQAANQETLALVSDVRSGRYISAVIRGNQLLKSGALTEPAEAETQLLLLEAYTALEALGPARTACEAYRGLVPNVELDPLTTSPKILRLCPNGTPQPEANADAAPAPPTEDTSHDESTRQP